MSTSIEYPPFPGQGGEARDASEEPLPPLPSEESTTELSSTIQNHLALAHPSHSQPLPPPPHPHSRHHPPLPPPSIPTALQSPPPPPPPPQAQLPPPQSPTHTHTNIIPIVSPLNAIPPDIATHRAHLFSLSTPATLSLNAWNTFWPYIDNVWCIHQKPQPSPATGIARVYGACRLARKTYNPKPKAADPNQNSDGTTSTRGPGRPKKRREGEQCKAKFRLTMYPDGKRVVERTGEEEHTHDLDYIDSVKRNSGVRGLVFDTFFKGWEAGGILAFLRDTSASAVSKAAKSSVSNPGSGAGDARNPNTNNDGQEGESIGVGTATNQQNNILHAAGGIYLTRQEVQNILNSALRRAYPGQEISTIKKQMDKYKNYTTCNSKGCSATPFKDIKALMEHRRAVHGLKSHDHSEKQFACPEKGCWRHKKSKGFVTRVAMEGHVREKHPERLGLGVDGGAWVAGQEAGGQVPLVRQTGGAAQTADADADADPDAEGDEMHGIESFAQADPFGDGTSMFPHHNHVDHPHPITPESSAEPDRLLITDRSISALQQFTSVMRPNQDGTLSQEDKEILKVKIRRLMDDRQKLDMEIARLNGLVWGEGGG